MFLSTLDAFPHCQGLMDVALLTANCAQLRQVKKSPSSKLFCEN